jgi:hypothetical protein
MADNISDYPDQSEQLAISCENESAFRHQLEHLLNGHSKENGSDTPDFILAEYLITCLKAFDCATRSRTRWYGKSNEDKSENVPQPNNSR